MLQSLTTFAASSGVQDLNLDVPGLHWILLFCWFVSLILIDIFIFHREDHDPSLKEAVLQSAVWIILGIGLGVLVWLQYGSEAGVQYYSGYLVEKSLSIDNVFAWSLIFAYFKIPKKYQHRVLFWGVIGAITLRAIFVFAGLALIQKFEPILIVFGLILILSGLRIIKTHREHEYDPSNSRFFKFAQRIIPVSKNLDGHKLFTRENGKRVATMLFMTLLVIEFTDVVFAVDSVPAILAVSQEPFIIIASNAAAILGMRALYFVFDIIKDQFWLLNYALGLLLLFVGIKMFIAPSYLFRYAWFDIHIPTALSLLIISILLAGGIVGSLAIKKPARLA